MKHTRSLLVLALTVVAGCSSQNEAGGGPDAAPPETDAAVETDAGSEDAAPVDAGPDPLPGCTRDPGLGGATVPAGGDTDPIGGAEKLTLDQALVGFPAGDGVLTAAIATELGTIVCSLDEKAAPVAVANFIGLARGSRAYQDPKTNAWTAKPFYDGLIWHRVIPGFVIQGGDPLGNGTGGPGYDLPEENHVAEPKGTLAMAAGAAPSGSQFYIVVGTGPAPNYNVFGKCTTDVAVAIAGVSRDANDKPKTAVHLKSVTIARCPSAP